MDNHHAVLGELRISQAYIVKGQTFTILKNNKNNNNMKKDQENNIILIIQL